jgi:hypothetical protein
MHPGDGICASAGAICTLRASIQEANASAGDDIINLPAGTYILTIGNPQEDACLEGDLDINSNLSIRGAGMDSTIIDGNSIDRVFHILNGKTASIAHLAIKNGSHVYSLGGGGILNDNGTLTLNSVKVDANTGSGIRNLFEQITLNNSLVSNNSERGIDNFQGTVILNNSTITSNMGGIENNSGNIILNYTSVKQNLGNYYSVINLEGDMIVNYSTIDDNPGGISNFMGTITLKNSTISNNGTATYGGGIRNESGNQIIGTIAIENSTISGNTAQFSGGGIVNYGSVSLNNCTITNNNLTGVAASGGGICNGPNPGYTSLTMHNSIIAENTSPSSPDCYGDSITSEGYNLIGDTSGCLINSGAGDMAGIDPLLNPLADNGGPTLTHKLMSGSPVIDAGDASSCPFIDQRGVERPQDGDFDESAVCDIGAFEWRFDIPENPAPENLLDIFGFELNNKWTYEGTKKGAPYTIVREITGLDKSTFPVLTYVNEIKENGIVAGSEWFEKTGDQIKLWGTTIDDEGELYNIYFSEGLKAVWYPMAVGETEYSTAFTSILGFPFEVSLTVTVLAGETVALNFDTLEALKVQYQLHLWGDGFDETSTFYWWMAPYLGVIKDEDAEYSVKLTSFVIGSGSVSHPGDKDDDGLSDYDELFKLGTHWFIADTDNDGLNDGVEFAYWGSAWNADPDGDLLANLLDPDSDNDKLNDGLEVNILGTDPALKDTDHDGTPDSDEDNDGDRFSNAAEVQCGSDPMDPESKCLRVLSWLLLLLD